MLLLCQDEQGPGEILKELLWAKDLLGNLGKVKKAFGEPATSFPISEGMKDMAQGTLFLWTEENSRMEDK